MRRDMWLAGVAGVVLGSWLTLIVVQLQEHGFGIPSRSTSETVAENHETVAAPPARETAKAEVAAQPAQTQPVQAQPEATKQDNAPAATAPATTDTSVQPATVTAQATPAAATTAPATVATAPSTVTPAPVKVASETNPSPDNGTAAPSTTAPSTTTPAATAETTPTATPASTSEDAAKAAIASSSDQNKKDNPVAATQPTKAPQGKSATEVAQLRVTPSSKTETQAAQAKIAGKAQPEATATAKATPGKANPKQEPAKQVASAEVGTNPLSAGSASLNPATATQTSPGQTSTTPSSTASASTAPASATSTASTPASSDAALAAQAAPEQIPADQADRELDASAHRTAPNTSTPAPTEQASLGGEQKPGDAAKSIELVRPFADRAGILTIGGKSVQLPGIIPTDADRTCIGPNGKEWPCGTMARTAFRMYLRGRTIDCDLPSPIWKGTVTGACRYARIDLSEWLVRFGWALPEAGSPLAALADEARAQKRGLYGDDPRIGGKSTLGPAPAKEDPLNPI
ncbi:MAG: hypothetical protein KGI75_03035 [Rhizobiaceae bacterium]|nr:hypothetical protein [Rhizobiaceae bacterium]